MGSDRLLPPDPLGAQTAQRVQTNSGHRYRARRSSVLVRLAPRVRIRPAKAGSVSSQVVALRSLLVTLLLLALGTACGSSGGRAVDPTAAIEGFDPTAETQRRSRSDLNTAMLAERDATREAALSHLDASDSDVRMAAVYALTLTLRPGDASTLAPLLKSPRPAERVLAASGLLALGEGRAVPVLIDALGIDEPLPFGAPPVRVWEQARLALLSFTGQDFGLQKARGVERAKASVPRWRAWWAGARASFEVVRAPGRFGS
jgi:hypothetical protein